MMEGTALPKGVVKSDVRPKVIDQNAFLRLNDLVRRAAIELSVLNQDPVAVASSPSRFNDAWNSEWCAVRCGKFFSEKSGYDTEKFDLDRDIIEARGEAIAAHKVLLALERAGWRDLFVLAFDLEGCWDQCLALVIQDGLSWLVFSSNEAASAVNDSVFTIWDNGPMRYFGQAKSRFDWAIQDERPLVFVTIWEATDDA